MFDFDIFKQEIIDCYREKQSNGLLPPKLERPSPSHIREVALSLFYDDLNHDDLKVFEAFFYADRRFETLESAIREIDLERLKPLQNFIQGRTTSPNEDVIKLLAILIDFQPRPFSSWRKQKSNAVESNDTLEVEEITASRHEPQPVGVTTKQEDKTLASSPKIRKPLNRNFLLILATGLIIAFVFLISQYYKTGNCAYWNGEKYIQVDCGDKMGDLVIIKINDWENENFRKIMRADTLDESDEHKVWYSKINGEVEFFTAPGYHPLKRNKPLKPATRYMIEKYRSSL